MMNDPVRAEILSRLDAVRERIANACIRSRRSSSDVTLVAVTKTAPVSVARYVHELGVLDLGENRPQELWRKRAAMPASVRWHLVGHLQRNKIEATLPVYLIHSVDSLRLLKSIDGAARKRGLKPAVLLEFNVSGEPSKHGFAPSDVSEVAQCLPQFTSVNVRGLMTMAPLADDPEACRGVFARLRELREQLNGQLLGIVQLQELSMGMSNDFEIAIEEGATLVRIGSAIFAGLPP